MALEGYQLAEHAQQLGEIAAAIITMEGMKAENQMRAIRDESPAYTIEQFKEILSEYGLHYNQLVEKARRF